MAQVEGGRQKPEGDEREGEEEAGYGEPAALGQRVPAREQRQRGEQSIARARKSGEQNDGIGWMHGYRESSLSIQPRNPPGSSSLPPPPRLLSPMRSMSSAASDFGPPASAPRR